MYDLKRIRTYITANSREHHINTKTNTRGITPNTSTEAYNYSGSTIMHHIETVKLPENISQLLADRCATFTTPLTDMDLSTCHTAMARRYQSLGQESEIRIRQRPSEAHYPVPRR